MFTGTIVWKPVVDLQKELNPDWFSKDTIRGFIILMAVIGVMVCVAKKLTHFVTTGVMLLVLFQICHVFGTSELGMRVVPWMQTIFPHDILQSIAQVFVNTPIATWILYVQAFLNQTFGLAFEAVLVIWKIVKPYFRMVVDSLQQFRVS